MSMVKGSAKQRKNKNLREEDKTRSRVLDLIPQVAKFQDVL